MQELFSYLIPPAHPRAIVAVDLFCGAGGLTRGLLDAGIKVAAGYDIDPACEFPYEHNNAPAVFEEQSVAEISGSDLVAHYPAGCWRVLVGCAPCQPFSRYAQGCEPDAEKWGLLSHFARLVEELKPDVVSMENVPELQRHEVYRKFLAKLRSLHYAITEKVIYCPDYGLAQMRSRLVLFASLVGEVRLTKRTHPKKRYRTVRMEIGDMPPLTAGGICPDDPLHRCASLSQRNLTRIQHSAPNGTWRDWPRELVAQCHQKREGKNYASVYGRMAWDLPSPTITTQFFGFGSGRFGHPVEDRALSLREGATLQSFGRDYEFVRPGEKVAIGTVGRMIGNAVPVRLGRVVGKSISDHLHSKKR